ncbi:MAG TPA: helix-turn-helix transcriptional regulator [bacterium]|nr:helix-turn-helix transcriptional regulator [bacterium]
MIPVGRAIQAWRCSRGLSQEALARRAGIPRPNLSVLEQGGRDLTLSTLYRMARALGIRPGILADGVLPGAQTSWKPWTREELDRIARYVAGREVLMPDARSRKAAQTLREILKQKMAGGSYRLPRRGARAEKMAYRMARKYFSAGELNNLLSRIRKWHEAQNEPA